MVSQVLFEVWDPSPYIRYLDPWELCSTRGKGRRGRLCCTSSASASGLFHGCEFGPHLPRLYIKYSILEITIYYMLELHIVFQMLYGAIAGGQLLGVRPYISRTRRTYNPKPPDHRAYVALLSLTPNPKLPLKYLLGKLREPGS